MYKPNKAPAFQFYASDFLSDINVSMMSMSQRGIYVTLLAYEWIEGSLPSDLDRLKLLCGNPVDFDSDWLVVSACFYEEDGRIYNKRLEKERQNMLSYRERMSKNGRRGANIRWNNKDGKAIAKPSNIEDEDEKEVEVKHTNSYKKEFEEEFWSLYPRRDNKKRSCEKYMNLRKNGTDKSLIINGLKHYIKHWRSSGTEPEYIPMASTWLNQERYADESIGNVNTLKNLDLKKTFNWECDKCGERTTSDKTLTTSDRLCGVCNEGFLCSPKELEIERAVIKAEKKQSVDKASTEGNPEVLESDDAKVFNELVGSLVKNMDV